MYFVIDEFRLLNIIEKEFRINTSSSLNWYVSEDNVLNMFIDIPDCKTTYLFRKLLDDKMQIDFRIRALLTKDNSILGTLDVEDVEIKQSNMQGPVIMDASLLKQIWGS